MKRKLFKTAVLLIALLAVGVGIFSYRAFHTSGAWIARSPANQRWAVDLVVSGFQDIGVDFRVHDYTSSPFQPRYVCDLFWEGRYMANEIHWSSDGTVAAAAPLGRDAGARCTERCAASAEAAGGTAGRRRRPVVDRRPVGPVSAGQRVPR